MTTARARRLLILASGLGHFGWGAVLPYQYIYASQTRGWGPLFGALAASLFSVGALLGSPVLGHLTGSLAPHRILLVAWATAIAGTFGMVLAADPVTFAISCLVFGFGTIGSGPPKSVLLLRWSSGEDQRRAFAYRFTAESVGLALGALISGMLVDLSRPSGMVVSYLMVVVSLLIGSAIALLAARAAPAESLSVSGRADHPSMLRSIGSMIAIPPLRWLAVLIVCLSLAFYAPFEAGLPAYALTVLHMPARAVGWAAAANCLAIAALQPFMLRATRGRQPARLMMVVGGIWVLCWIVLGAAASVHGAAVYLFVGIFAVFAVGETIFTPILNPLVAQLSSPAILGASIGTFAALLTTFSAVGPLVAGTVLGHGLPQVFIGLHLLISVFAVYAAVRLHRLLPRTG